MCPERMRLIHRPDLCMSLLLCGNKKVDIQNVAIVQNGENVATEKTGRTGALPHIGTAWYRNTFTLPKEAKGKKVLLLFEGAMSEPQVYLNGKKGGEWAYG